MGVPCPGCGRQYDPALFSFGRTIHCTCGERVAMAPRVRELGAGGALRFSADAMLGGLARWLRILGFDTTWREGIEDGDLVRQALEEERVLLTRDRRLLEEWTLGEGVWIEAEEPLAQLRELASHFALLDRARPFTRCSRCNERLVEASAEDVRGRVPERVLAGRTRFRRCPGCERVYWEGSHTRRMRDALEGALGAIPRGL